MVLSKPKTDRTSIAPERASQGVCFLSRSHARPVNELFGSPNATVCDKEKRGRPNEEKNLVTAERIGSPNKEKKLVTT
jgi:hypothetical protein